MDVPAFQVLDFDINTGIISNPISLSTSGVSKAYALEFSPDGTRIYTADQFSGKVYQFNLLAGSPNAIANSGVLVGTSVSAVGGLQLARDNKIYIARNTSNDLGQAYLAVINFPNLAGTASNFVDNGIYLGGKNSRWTLPNDMVSLQNPQPLSISGDSVICSGDSAVLTVTGSSNIQWVKGSTATTNTILVYPTSTSIYSVVDLNSVCGDTASFSVNVSAGGAISISARVILLPST